MAASRSLKTLKITLSYGSCLLLAEIRPDGVSRRSRAASWFGKWNSPVEMQQKATLRRPCSAASVQAGAVAGGQLLAGPARSPSALHDGPHGVEHIPGWEVIGPSVSLARPVGSGCPWACMSCDAGVPELEPRRRVDGVVDAAVAGSEAPQQGGVGRVDNGVRLQAGDVPLPEDRVRGSAGGRPAGASPSTTPFSSRSAESSASWTCQKFRV